MESWRSYGHEEAGVDLAKKMLKRLTRRIELIACSGKISEISYGAGTIC